MKLGDLGSSVASFYANLLCDFTILVDLSELQASLYT